MADRDVLIFYMLANFLPSFSITESRVLIALTITVVLSISTFNSASFCFLYFQALVFDPFMYKLL